MKWLTILAVSLAAALGSVHADDFPKLDEAMPRNIDIRGITPLIDTDTDSCLPSAMDQSVNLIPSGHKNDLEQVAFWTIDGRISHGSFSAHGKLETKPADQLDKQDGHLKFVCHKDCGLTHCFRFAKPNEVAENPAGSWVLPTLVSWYTMQGDGIDNVGLRDKLNNYDYGTASLQIKDSGFRWNTNTFRPSEFPEFSDDDVNDS